MVSNVDELSAHAGEARGVRGGQEKFAAMPLRICNRYGLNDIDLESLHAYRNQFASYKSGHPWLGADDTEFLHLLGAWREDRETKENGLTLAGLLMFGQWPAIMTCAPLYFVDYQEKPDEPDTSVRWLDRVVPDGTWSGNLFDFYRKVIRKLTADLKVPFHLQGDKRVDDTPIHQALREALVNTLVHADYSDRASVRVIKRPSGFEFRNPGALHVPVAQSLMTMDWALETVSGKMSGKATLEILGLIKQDSRLTVSELAITLELSERTIERAIQSLRADGRLERIGPSKGGFWKVLK
jgi:predicted HTH transcriptional regulator